MTRQRRSGIRVTSPWLVAVLLLAGCAHAPAPVLPVAPAIKPSPVQCSDLVSCGARGDGVTDDTAAFLAAVNATPLGGALTISTAQTCFRISAPVVITKAISIRGEGWASDSWGMRFGEAGFLAHFHGSVLCSDVSSGTALTLTPSAGGRFANFAVIGPGKGTSTGVSFGAPGRYLQVSSIDNVVSGNFANPVYIFAQNSTFNGLRVDGAAPAGADLIGTGVYIGSVPSGSSNSNTFTGLVIAGGNHVNLYASGQVNVFNGFDLENPAPNDPTATQIEAWLCNECVFTGGYIESAAGQNYTGENIVVDGPATRSNSIGATFTNMHISGGPTSIHLKHAYHTTIHGGQVGRILIDATSGPTNLFAVDYDALENDGGQTNNLQEGAAW